MVAVCSVIQRLAAALLTCVLVAAGAMLAPSGAAATTRATAHTVAANPACPWLDTRLTIARRVSMLMSRMTLADKIAEMQVQDETYTGPYAGYEGYVASQPALCIPDVIEQDDSLGVGGLPGGTQLPSEVALGATWDPSLARAYGAVNGRQHRDKGIAMTLGPGINIQRDPRWGRNFEMFSEDPLLTARMGAADIEGIQSQHEMVDVKHLLAYNQETYRNTPDDDAIVSQRTLHEIYLPPFYSAVTQAKAASVMCSYALLNGQYSCSDPLLATILDDDWGFTGFLRTDGGALHDTVASALAGLAQEKGAGFWGSGLLSDAIADGQVPMAMINGAVSRILGEMFRFDLFDRPPTGTPDTPVQTPGDVALSALVAEHGTVLLRDKDDVLPINTSTTHSIAVLGSDCTTGPRSSGGGSSYVPPASIVSPLQGIYDRAGPGVTVSSYAGNNAAAAAAAARTAQVAVVCLSQYEREGADLSSISFNSTANSLVSAVAAANPNTIVVLNTGGPVTMPWLSHVRGVLEAWYPGQQDGAALAAVLFGDVDPGGHLTETFPKSLSQLPTDRPARWPGVDGRVFYNEGLDVGYRYDAARHITPLFPFGFGLSYTHFSYRRLQIKADPVNATSGPDGGQSATVATVTATVTNTGAVSGSDVAQLYVDDPRAVGEPPEQLEGFQRVQLAPGQSTTVRFALSGHSLSWYDSRISGWVLPTGRFGVSVGDSSSPHDLPLRGAFTIAHSVGYRRAVLSTPAHIVPGRPFTVLARFDNSGGVTQPAGTPQLIVPTGWRVKLLSGSASRASRLAAATVGPVSPYRTAYRRFEVTAPLRTPAQPVVLRLSLTGAGTGDVSSFRQATVVSPVLVTPAPIVVASPGVAVGTSIVVQNRLGHAVSVVLHPRAALGVTVSPAQIPLTLASHARQTVAVTVTAAAGTPSGREEISLDPTVQGMSVAPAALQVAEPYADLADADDLNAVSDDSDIAAANLDGAGDSYSAQALAGAGVSPGATTDVGGVGVTWPATPPGTADAVLANGQTIAVPADPGATQLAVIGASSSTDLSSHGTIEYTDGTVQPFTLTLDDWAQPPINGADQTVASMSYNNDSSGIANAGVVGLRQRNVRLYGTDIGLEPGRTVADVTLPQDGDLPQDSMDVFALGLG